MLPQAEPQLAEHLRLVVQRAALRLEALQGVLQREERPVVLLQAARLVALGLAARSEHLAQVVLA